MLVNYRPWRHENDNWGVTIEQGRFDGTSVAINNIELIEEDSSLAVDFNFLTTTPGTDPEKIDKEEFDNIFQHIIEDVIRHALELANQNENRNTDTE